MRRCLRETPTRVQPTRPAATFAKPTGNEGNLGQQISVMLSEGRVMYCNHCGKVIQDDAAICAYCGVRIGSCLARRKLMRPRVGRKIAGVCLGFSEYFDIDVTLVRVVWLMVAFMTVIGFLSYPIAWIIMPEKRPLLPVP